MPPWSCTSEVNTSRRIRRLLWTRSTNSRAQRKGSWARRNLMLALTWLSGFFGKLDTSRSVCRLLWPRTTHSRSHRIGSRACREVISPLAWVSGLVMVRLTDVRRMVRTPTAAVRGAWAFLCRTVWTEHTTHSFESSSDFPGSPAWAWHPHCSAVLRRLVRS